MGQRPKGRGGARCDRRQADSSQGPLRDFHGLFKGFHRRRTDFNCTPKTASWRTVRFDITKPVRNAGCACGHCGHLIGLKLMRVASRRRRRRRRRTNGEIAERGWSPRKLCSDLTILQLLFTCGEDVMYSKKSSVSLIYVNEFKKDKKPHQALANCHE